MIQFENSEYIVIIEDSFVEAILNVVQWRKERFKQDIEELIVEEAVYQMGDGFKYIRFSFVPDDTARELDAHTWLIYFIVDKKNVTIRNKRKKVRIKEGSLYEGLNDNPEFIEALTEEYNTNYGSYAYYLPVSYRDRLVHKENNIGDFMNLHVDIPFRDIETVRN